jgi:hypothetical protein
MIRNAFRNYRRNLAGRNLRRGIGIREIARLRRVYGRGRWRKRKGVARVRLADGSSHLAEVHWYESAARNSRSSTCSETEIMAKSQAKQTQAKQLVVCIKNEGYRASLEKRKIYVTLRDAAAEKHGLLRIVDESGEDYLFPKAFFRAIALPQSVKRAVLAAA